MKPAAAPVFRALLTAAALCALAAGAGAARAEVYTNSLGMEFVRIRAGSFMMGNDPELYEPLEDDEEPQHEVVLTRDYWMGAHEVTQSQWEELMGGGHLSEVLGPDAPVTGITFGQAMDFIRRLNAREDTKMYRLPTEAEWEYAARAGTAEPWHFGGDEYLLPDYDWADNITEGVRDVGLKKPNPWGLYDIHGNAKEMTSDWYGKDYYESSPKTDPQGPEFSERNARSVRGGAWYNTPARTRSSYRFFLDEGEADPDIGLRLAFTDGLLPK
jgi:formylglycine-generating enzyme required for sulfatase activity